MKDRIPENQGPLKRKFSAIDKAERPPRRRYTKFVYSYSGFPIPVDAKVIGEGNRKRIKDDQIEGLFWSVTGKKSFYKRDYYFYDQVKSATENKIFPDKLTASMAAGILFQEGQLRFNGRIVISTTQYIYKQSAMLVPFTAVIEFHQGGRVKKHEGQHVLAVYAFLNRIRKSLNLDMPVKNKKQKLSEEEPNILQKKLPTKAAIKKITPKIKFPYRVVPHQEGSTHRFFSINRMEGSYERTKVKDHEKMKVKEQDKSNHTLALRRSAD